MDERTGAHDQNRGCSVSGLLFITGHAGLAGGALVRAAATASREVITASRAELDLSDGGAVAAYLKAQRPSAIIHAAARNAGIAIHETQPADMLADNLAITLNTIRAAAEAGVPRLLYISSATVYSPDGTLPAGPTAGYGLAKIAGMMLCEAVRRQHGLCYHSIIPCNLYGPGDNFHPDHATVLPGMMRRMHDALLSGAGEFRVWGSGRQSREFLHADDLAAACLLLLELPDPPARVDCSPGISTTILELAEQLKELSGFTGKIVTDPSKPDGTPRPLLDSTQLRGLGWLPRIPLEEGLRSTWEAFRAAYLAGTLRGG